MNKIVTAIKTTSQPPAVLVEELQSLEKEHAAASAEYAELKRRMDQENARSIEPQRNSDAFKNALRATDLETRLRLRAELRKRIRRIDLYPVGLKRTWENGSRLDAEGSRVFQITFANDVERWVLCDTPDSGDAAVISMNPTVQGARRSQKAAKRARIEDSRPMAKTRSR